MDAFEEKLIDQKEKKCIIEEKGIAGQKNIIKQI